MDISREEAERLYQKFLDNSCTEAELQELIRILGANPDNFREDLVFQLFDKTWDRVDLVPHQFQPLVLPEAESKKTLVVNPDRDQIQRVNTFRKTWLRYAAAALLLLAVGAYMWRTSRPDKTFIVNKQKAPNPVKDLTPGGDRAVLTLADGTDVLLDSLHTGVFRQQGSATISKSARGALVYRYQSGGLRQPIVYNTMKTPRGGQYQLTLPDGSEVYLNASSSIRFPTSFSGKERRVEITGEAYFEVAKDPSMPFIVSVKQIEVKVLGTHFNVNAYADESAARTTLFEGAVQIKTNNSTEFLSPGQQGIVNAANPITVDKQADTASALAWKKGLFRFNNTELESIMRQVARWYDVDINYKISTGGLHFSGVVSRKKNVSELLKIMELTGLVNFKIEGKTITVLPG